MRGELACAPGGDVGRVLHDEESVDGAGQGGNVVEPSRIAGRRGIGVHRHLPVRVHLVQRVGDRRHQAGQAGLVGISRALEVEIHSVEILRLERSDQCLGKRGGGGWIRGQRIERVLIEVVDREDDPDAGTVSLRDQGGESLALIAVPSGPGLVQGSVGVDTDGEVVERGQSGRRWVPYFGPGSSRGRSQRLREAKGVPRWPPIAVRPPGAPWRPEEPASSTPSGA